MQEDSSEQVPQLQNQQELGAVNLVIRQSHPNDQFQITGSEFQDNSPHAQADERFLTSGHGSGFADPHF